MVSWSLFCSTCIFRKFSIDYNNFLLMRGICFLVDICYLKCDMYAFVLELDSEKDIPDNLGSQFTDHYIKNTDNVALLLSLLEVCI